MNLIRRTAFVVFPMIAAVFLHADTLPLGVTVAAVAVDNTAGNLCSQSGVNSATCSVSGSTATAVVNNGSGGIASVSLGANATGGAAITEYYFGITGPTTENIPILINGYANTTDSGALSASFSYAAYYIYQGTQSGATFVGDYFASPDACPYFEQENINCMSTGNFTLKSSVQSNSVFFVFFEAAAGGTNASALIDPTISIDPTFADASQFTIQANPGVFVPATPATAPEPASAALIAVSLAALAVPLSRKYKSTRNRL